MWWIPPVITGLAAILGLYLSKPKRRRVAGIAAVLIASGTGWQAWDEYEDQQRRRHIEGHVVDQLSRAVNQFLDDLGAIAIRGSENYVPDTDEKFFSERMAVIICRETDVWAATADRASIAQSIAGRAQALREELRRLIDTHSGDMSARLLAAATRVGSSSGLESLQSAAKTRALDIQAGTDRPPLLCWGLEPLLADLLAELSELVRWLREGRREFRPDIREDWLRYPSDYLRKFQGLDRFSPEALARFQAEHPNAPGPARFGKGNPNKDPELDRRSQPWRAR